MEYRGKLVLVTSITDTRFEFEGILAECASAAALILSPSTPREFGRETGPLLLRRSTWATGETVIQALAAVTGPSDAARRPVIAAPVDGEAAWLATRRESALVSLLAGTADPEIPAAIAGLRPDRGYVVIAAAIAPDDAEWLCTAVSMEFPDMRGLFSDGAFLGVLPVADGEGAGQVVGRLRSRIGRSAGGGADLPIGVGLVADGVAELHVSAASARRVLRALNVKLGRLPLCGSGWARIGAAHDVEDALVLIHATDALTPYAELFAARLRVLDDYDRAHRTDLLATVLAALKQQTNVAAAARPLRIHANSFRARLERIAVIAGIDLTDEVCRLRTILAFISCPELHNAALRRLPLDRSPNA